MSEFNRHPTDVKSINKQKRHWGNFDYLMKNPLKLSWRSLRFLYIVGHKRLGNVFQT